MNADRLLEVYEQISEAPNAIARLRRFVLDLAVRGKLVDQDAGDEPASELLKKFIGIKAELVKSKMIRKPKALKPISDVEALSYTPFGWETQRLGSTSILITKGSTPTSYGHEFTQEGVNFLKVESIRNDRVDASSITAFISNETHEFLSRSQLEAGDILFSIAGSIGTCAVVSADILPANTNQALAIIRGTATVFSPDFLLLLLRSFVSDAVKDRARGGAMNNVSLTDLQNLVLPIPPLAEQNRIVAKVDELMALCDRLEEARKTREEVRDKLTAASLARLTAPETTAEDFPTHAAFALEALPALTTRPDQIKTLRQTILNLAVRGKLVECADGSFQPVKKFRKLQNGYAFKSSWFAKSGTRLLRNANIGHGEIRWNETVYLPKEMASEYERFELNEGDIVLTLDRPFIVTGTKVARIGSADLPSLLLQRVGRFVEVEKGLTDDYLFMWINSPHFNEQIDPGRSNGVPHISSKQVEAAEIFVPSIDEQYRIVAKVDALMALCDRLEAALTTTDTTRTRLLEALLHEALDPVAQRDNAA